MLQVFFFNAKHMHNDKENEICTKLHEKYEKYRLSSSSCSTIRSVFGMEKPQPENRIITIQLFYHHKIQSIFAHVRSCPHMPYVFRLSIPFRSSRNPENRRRRTLITIVVVVVVIIVVDAIFFHLVILFMSDIAKNVYRYCDSALHLALARIIVHLYVFCGISWVLGIAVRFQTYASSSCR